MTVSPVPDLRGLYEIEIEDLVQKLKELQNTHGKKAKVRFDAGLASVNVYVKRVQ